MTMKKRYGIDYLPGTGMTPIHTEDTETEWRGGIFGQPPIPSGRRGIFKAYYAIPPEDAYNDTGVFDGITGKKIPGTVMDGGKPLLQEPIGAYGQNEAGGGLVDWAKAVVLGSGPLAGESTPRMIRTGLVIIGMCSLLRGKGK